MSRPPTSGRARRISGALLLALAPLVWVGASEPHFDHRVGQLETPIFLDANHAGQANHWEAANSVRSRQCPACLAPAQPLELALEGVRRPLQWGNSAAPAILRSGTPEPGAHRSQRPRGPPTS